MNEPLLFGSGADFFIQFLYYLLLTTHICLFVDMSRFQKHPTCKLNYLIASTVSAIIPSIAIRFMSFPSVLYKHAAGVGIAVILSIVITLFIQQVIKIDIDF